MEISNLFSLPPPPAEGEDFTVLAESAGVRVERIVSRGQRSPDGFWYDQDRQEWVAVLRGSAGLQIEGEPAVRILRPGDALTIPAHCRHRVAWTDPEVETVWLAVHFV